MVTAVARLVCSEVAQGSSACSDAVCYADDTTVLMRVPIGGRKKCGKLLNSNLERILNLAKQWLLEF